jgi:hypothetical protein
MALPVVSTPTFTTKIPSTGEEIEYRPFLVKEEKTLLIALEGQDNKEISNAVNRLLKDCIISPCDVDKLATFDIEYLFLKLRGKSVGEVINVTVGHTDSENECKQRTEVQIVIDDIEVSGDIKDGKVMLTDNLGVMLKYPRMNALADRNMDNAENIFKFVGEHIEYVFDAEQIYTDFTRTEIEDWMGTLNQTQFQKIANWYADIPSLKHEVEWKCQGCGKEDKITLEGLQSFFT